MTLGLVTHVPIQFEKQKGTLGRNVSLTSPWAPTLSKQDVKRPPVCQSCVKWTSCTFSLIWAAERQNTGKNWIWTLSQKEGFLRSQNNVLEWAKSLNREDSILGGWERLGSSDTNVFPIHLVFEGVVPFLWLYSKPKNFQCLLG